MRMPFILFFIAGMTPTKEEAEAALEIGVVAFRNASLIGETDRAEPCDAVAGDAIPKPYAAFPVVKSLNQAVAILKDKQKAANATAAAELANAPSPEVVGTKSAVAGEKGAKAATGGTGGEKGSTPPATGWKANA